MAQSASLERYRLLGRSGLRVSPLALGTMTFGTEWGWGGDEKEARSIFDAYVEQGGNFLDGANVYTDGAAERLLGVFAGKRRNRLVIATKYTLQTDPGDPNSGGNHRKSMRASVEESLRRLRTDYIDLLYLHAWDFSTPVEEVLRGMDDLVRSGKVLHVGISNTPAWVVAKMQTVAEFRSFTPLIALQIEYNLLQRTPERDLIPAAKELGIALVTYSPLAEGLLAGRYTQDDLDKSRRLPPDGTRKSTILSRGVWSPRNLTIVEAVKKVASELERPVAQVAIAWAIQSSAITSVLIGARTLAQFQNNLRAVDICFSEPQRSQLNEVSAIELGYPHDDLAWLHKTNYMGNSMSFAEVT